MCSLPVRISVSGDFHSAQLAGSPFWALIHSWPTRIDRFRDSASGIGDDAYYTSMGESYTGLMVKKGNTALKIAIYGNLPVEKKKSIEKALALQALSRM